MANPQMILIASQTLNGASSAVTFSSIPQIYTDLKLVASARQETGTNFVFNVSFNSGTSNLTSRYGTGDGASATSASSASTIVPTVNASGSTSSTYGNAEVYILNYAGSTYKSVSVDSVSENNAATAYARLLAGLWSDTSAINSITITSPSGNFTQNSTFYLYGITRQ